MKKRFPVIIAFVFGALPFLIGCIQNWYMLTYVDSVLPYGFISLAVLCLWGCIAFLLNDRSHSTKAIVISLNLIASLDAWYPGTISSCLLDELCWKLVTIFLLAYVKTRLQSNKLES